jgi:LysM domain
MRRWEHHRTRSKVALLLLINLVALLGGKYAALITIVKIELFGEAIAFAKAPKKKPPKPHLGRTQLDHPPPPPTTPTLATLDGKQRRPRALLHVIRRGETLSEIAASYGISVEALRRANQLRNSNHVIVGEALRIPPQEGPEASVEFRQTVNAGQGPPGSPLASGGPAHLALWRTRPRDGRGRHAIPCRNRHQSPHWDPGAGRTGRDRGLRWLQWGLRQGGEARPPEWHLNAVRP